MKIDVDENGEIMLTEVYSGISLKTEDGEKISICMRDSGFEFSYNGNKYEAKNGEVKILKQKETNEIFKKVLFEYGWRINLRKKSSDLYLENKNEDFVNCMVVDDGNIEMNDAVYHIYVDEDFDDKFFEGTISTIEELKVVMKVLGYEKRK
jgi:hypothetical protein